MRIFKETQKFTQTWLMILLAISLLVPVGIILKEYTKQGTNVTTRELILTISLMVVSLSPIFIFKLITRIDERGIHYCFFPIHRKLKLISWSNIDSIYLRNYNPISEYGGWGLKTGWGRKHGKAFNISGDLGIQLILKDGRKLLIGTQKKGEAQLVLDYYQSKLQQS